MDKQPTLSANSQRGQLWLDFSRQVLEHIEIYTVPQYGDFPDDQAASFTAEEIAMNMKRYLNRLSSNQRGQKEAIRDTYKLAHYACMLHLLALAELTDPNTACPNCGRKLGHRFTVCPSCGYCDNC